MEKGVNNNTAWFIVGLTILIALAVLFYANSNFYQEFTKTTEEVHNYAIPQKTKISHAIVELDFGNGKKRAFRGEVDGETYGFKYSLDLIAKVGKFNYREKNGWIDNLSGIGGTPGLWNIYRNGAPAEKLLHKLTVTGGDKYVLRFEK